MYGMDGRGNEGHTKPLSLLTEVRPQLASDVQQASPAVYHPRLRDRLVRVDLRCPCGAVR
jgi:hypothetical protein